MSSETIQTLQWVGDHTGHLTLIDQTLLPTELITIDCSSVEAVWEAIKVLRVRGAPGRSRDRAAGRDQWRRREGARGDEDD